MREHIFDISLLEPVMSMKPKNYRFMKSFLFSIFILFIFLPIKGERIITDLDIARWYLDADLAVICTDIERNTIHIRTVDTSGLGDYSYKYDLMKDIYTIVIDSILKGHSNLDTILIITPEYSTNNSKYKISQSDNFKVTPEGDTLHFGNITVIPNNYDSFSYLRLGPGNENIVFLKNTGDSFMIIYVMRDVNNERLKFLNDVEKRGEKYFDIITTN